MRSFKNVEVTQQRLAAVTCNLCGKTGSRPEADYLDDWFSAEKTWGYGTDYDGETHSFDLCLDCYRKLAESMKVKPWEKEE